MSAHRVVDLGIARTFHEYRPVLNRRPFCKIFLLAGTVACRGIYSGIFYLLQAHGRESESTGARSKDIIDLMEIAHYRDQKIADLPYGARKNVELARALCARADASVAR